MSGLSLAQLDVLLVEPSTTQGHIVQGYLDRLGMAHHRRVAGAAEALSAMASRLPDVVISSMHLPDASGTELLQNMRADEQLAEIAFILISSETSRRYLEPLRQAGVTAILPKPFSRQQLRGALEATLDYLEPEPLELASFSPDELRVLIVDDSFTSRRIVRRMLEGMGVEDFTEAENGREAIERIGEQFFDLIVTDYHMPEVDGEQLSRFIRNESTQPGVPVLMVTSERDDSRLAAVQRSGVSALFDKPLSTGTLRQAVQRLLAE